MATITKWLGSFENGAVEFTIDIDDTTFIISAFRCVNASSQPAWGKATSIDTGRSYERVFNPGTITVVIPTNPGQRLSQYYDPVKGALTGIDFELMWPYIE